MAPAEPRVDVERAIHRVVVLEAGGRRLRRFIVDCPRGRSKDLTVCGRCPDCRGYTLQSLEGSTIVCSLWASEEICGASPGTVGAAMSRDVVCVAPDLPLGQALDLLAEHDARGVPVLDEADRPIGMMGLLDAILPPNDARSAPVRNHMIRGAATAKEGAPLDATRARMLAEGVRCLVVVDDEGRALGALHSVDA